MLRWGIVLGGGGLTGTAFHAGVLTALADLGWDARQADVLVGTSAGSTSAALLRAGFPPRDYVRRITGEPMSPEAERLLAHMGPIPPAPHRKRGRLQPAAPGLLRTAVTRGGRQPLGITMAGLLPEGTVDVDAMNPGVGDLFTAWPDQPMWIVAVDLEAGERVVFGRDHTATVADAVSASCAIPGYFRPIRIEGRRYVDGGVHSAHSADLLARAGLDLVIVSAPLAALSPQLTPGGGLRAVVSRHLAREVAAVRAGGTRVLVVAPDPGLCRLMGTNSMVLAKRPPVAIAAHAHARTRFAAAGFPHR